VETNILLPVIVVILPLIGGFVTWYLNERSKRIYEEYKRKEDRYSELIRRLRGFYVDSSSTELRNEFLNQINLCWMYCPDEVIQKAYKFLLTVHTDKRSSDDEKEGALGEFMLAIREDLINRQPLKKTGLKAEDFKHLRAVK